MSPYALLIGYTVVVVGIAFAWGKNWERNRQAAIRKASIRTRQFQPSTHITFN